MYLNCHTHFSLRYGCFSEKELLEMAAKAGCRSVALTDINNTSACLNFLRLAPQYDIHPVIGIDFRNAVDQQFVGLAVDNKGFLELNRFLSHHLHSDKGIPRYAPEMEHALIIYPLSKVCQWPAFIPAPHEFIGVGPGDLSKINGSDCKQYRDKMVVLHTVSFRHKRDYNLHRLLRAIDNNSLLSKLPASGHADATDQMMPLHELKHHFRRHTDILHRTQLLLDSCKITFDFSKKRKTQNLTTYGESKEEDCQLIRQLCRQQLTYRYDRVTDDIKERVRKEIDLIERMDFVAFFLINWDIVQYAKRKGYFHVGRGSGANSIVAYLLGITDVDPMQLDLYFERFMNLYRTTPPDFDIDFSWRDREDVTRYIFERFGQRGQAALLATYNTFRHSAAVRELGKVFGLPKHEIDRLSAGKFQYCKLDELSSLVVRYADYLKDMPNYLSVHAGGILISEKPIHYFSATNLPPKGFPTTQFDMIVAEDVGLYKFDILGQRGLAKIKDAVQIIKKNQPRAKHIDIHNVRPFYTDDHLNELVRKGNCIGCFYVESPAMRMLLRKLEVDNYLGLVAASSIIRPGVSKSGMMREYIRRHKFPEARKEAHPVLWELMEDTYGVMVYQEDVIKVAHYFAGLSLSEADVLRRGMSGKYRSRAEFQKVQQKFFENCLMKGYEPSVIKEVWRQIESFAGYAFAKGHSASYAVESYQSLFLKAYYPLEYMVAVLNNGGGFYSRELYIHEARMKGAQIHAPCVNKSSYQVEIEGRDIYLGFGMIKEFEQKQAFKIVQDRCDNGDFISLENFLERIPMSLEQMELLVRVDAFRFTGQDKRQLLWRVYYHCQAKTTVEEQPGLFGRKLTKVDVPEFEISQEENAFDQIELLGFPLCSPFDLLSAPIPSDCIRAVQMKMYKSRIVRMAGYLVSVKRTRTSGGKTMFFGTFIDREGRWVDTVHFPPVASRHPFRGPGIYVLRGKIMEEFEFLSLEVYNMERLPYIEDPRYALQ